MCLAIRVYDVMNKADVCGTSVHHVTNQLFLLFIFEKSEPTWLRPEEQPF